MLVQFSNVKKTEIIAYLAGPQDPEGFPNQGEIETDDPKWAIFYDKVHMWMDNLPKPTTSKR
ncbi:hypothetical protein [Yersinia mollaretii]|uniref:hypothetical protein n=1 Tax=Yersinia mollaretii TaxID=33060 RepID=UPI0011A4329E|nr:hypothetical protein [Yersinia mollaretii]